MPTHRCHITLAGGTLALFLGLVTSWAPLQAACVSDGLDLQGDCNAERFVEGEEEIPFDEFRVSGRVSFTAIDGFNNQRGEPVNLTWGLVDDGTLVQANEDSQPSDLIAMLNTRYGAGSGGIESAPWFRLFESAFDRWGEVTGVTFSYEPNDGGAPIDRTTFPFGINGVYPDVRIGGRSIDGATGSNVLAFNYFPNHSDMVLDTDNGSFFGNRFADSRLLRNTLMHEIGHGLGFSHLESDNSRQLMEPFIQSAIDGPQIDDILAGQRNYGDPLEKNGGNDSIGTATLAGEFAASDSWSIGVDGQSEVVNQNQTDFVSIDGLSDTDYFRFSVSEPTLVNLTLTQVGLTYNESAQDGDQEPLITSRLNDLKISLQALEAGGVDTVAEGVVDPNTVREKIALYQLQPGVDYFAEVTGSVDDVQLYRLDLNFQLIPEPTSATLASLLTFFLACRRRDA